MVFIGPHFGAIIQVEMAKIIMVNERKNPLIIFNVQAARK